jgi:hypothetical protein
MKILILPELKLNPTADWDDTAVKNFILPVTADPG